MKTKARKVMTVLFGRVCVAVEQPNGDREWYPIEGVIPTEPGAIRQWMLTPPKKPKEGPERYTVSEKAGGVLGCDCQANRFTKHGRVYLRAGFLICKHAAAVFDMLDEMGCSRGNSNPGRPGEGLAGHRGLDAPVAALGEHDPAGDTSRAVSTGGGNDQRNQDVALV